MFPVNSCAMRWPGKNPTSTPNKKNNLVVAAFFIAAPFFGGNRKLTDCAWSVAMLRRVAE
jgi:hypothetical protein